MTKLSRDLSKYLKRVKTNERRLFVAWCKASLLEYKFPLGVYNKTDLRKGAKSKEKKKAEEAKRELSKFQKVIVISSLFTTYFTIYHVSYGLPKKRKQQINHRLWMRLRAGPMKEILSFSRQQVCLHRCLPNTCRSKETVHSAKRKQLKPWTCMFETPSKMICTAW